MCFIIATGDDAYSMVVMWSTADEFDERPSYVHYGLGSHNFTLRSQAKAEDLSNYNPLGCKGTYNSDNCILLP